MRTLATVCAGLAVFSSIVSVHLWRELRVERQQNAALRTRLTEVALPVRQAVLPVQPLATTPAAPNTKDSVEISAAQTSPLVEAKMAEANAMYAVAQLSLSLGLPITELNKDPEYRNAQLTQRRLELAQYYPGLARELGLTDQEERQFFEIMAERRVKVTSQASGQPLAEQIEQRRRQVDSQKAIRDLLGETRFAQYPEYLQTRASRIQASNMEATLASAGLPLNDAQSRSLAIAVVAEDRRIRQEPPPPTPKADPANPPRGAGTLTEYQNLQTENYRRYLESASPVLSAAQLQTLRQQFEQQDAQRRSSFSRITQQLESAAGAAAAAAAGVQ